MLHIFSMPPVNAPARTCTFPRFAASIIIFCAAAISSTFVIRKLVFSAFQEPTDVEAPKTCTRAFDRHRTLDTYCCHFWWKHRYQILQCLNNSVCIAMILYLKSYYMSLTPQVVPHLSYPPCTTFCFKIQSLQALELFLEFADYHSDIYYFEPGPLCICAQTGAYKTFYWTMLSMTESTYISLCALKLLSTFLFLQLFVCSPTDYYHWKPKRLCQKCAEASAWRLLTKSRIFVLRLRLRRVCRVMTSREK